MDPQPSAASSSQPDPTPKSPTDKSSKAPVVRGARACTVCRAAKMKCVGAEDGQPCQRCKRSGSECIFEKHRRGRKPGSKLSEASKMLRRLEKGLNVAKLKSQTNESSSSLAFSSDQRSADRFPNNELPPLNLPANYDPAHPANPNARMPHDDDDDPEKPDEGLFPAKLIQKERNSSFFKTILNPEPYEPAPGSKSASERSHTVESQRQPTPPPARTLPPLHTVLTVPGLDDPVAAGIIDEAHAAVLFDLFFLRLNPFINLFDPALHTMPYIRARCPFLFTTLVMACCKFFEVAHYKRVQALAHAFAVRAFAEGWKRVEVCQAFACLTYWREPDDQRTWTYIGYACRMAVELGLNRYVGRRRPEEGGLQTLERRNRERTYLVLFVHDRSLSTQTGRQWMLPECELVRHAASWHEEGGAPVRPEDVILAAFVQLRLIASEMTDMFSSHRGVGGAAHADVNRDVLLRNCNGKLTQWMETWEGEMQKANGEKFHFAFLRFFRLYVRLFLNSFGIQASMTSTSQTSPSLQALSACYTSALENLQIVTKDFAAMSMLRYSQDSITTMTAYCAVFLLKLLRSSSTLAGLDEGATGEIYTHIAAAAEAYHEASLLSPSSSSAAHHARFLKSLVANDIFRAKERMQAQAAQGGQGGQQGQGQGQGQQGQGQMQQGQGQGGQQAQGGQRGQGTEGRAQGAFAWGSAHTLSPPQPMLGQSPSQGAVDGMHFGGAPPSMLAGPSSAYAAQAANGHGHGADFAAGAAGMRHVAAGGYSSTYGAPSHLGSPSQAHLSTHQQHQQHQHQPHAPPQQPTHAHGHAPQQQQQAAPVFAPAPAFTTTEEDATYWKNMFRELGDIVDGSYNPAGGLPMLADVPAFSFGVGGGGGGGMNGHGGVNGHGGGSGNGNGSNGVSGGNGGGGGAYEHPARSAYADMSGARYQPYPTPSYGGHGHVGGYGLAGR